MTPGEWLQHGSEGVVVLGAFVAGWRRLRAQIDRLEKVVSDIGSIDGIKLSLEAHIAKPAAEAHGVPVPTPNGRGPLPSSPGTA